MIKLTQKLSPQSIKRAIYALSASKRKKLLTELQKDLFPAQLDEIVKSLRSKAKTTSLKKITQITNRVRKKLYAQTT